MIRVFLAKEWREHRLVLVPVLVLVLLGLIANWMDDIRNANPGGVLGGLGWYLMVVGVLVSLLASQRLVAKEYGGRTQVFLEALPLSRVRFVGVKFFFGLVLVLGLGGLALGLSILLAQGSEHITSRFIGILFLRALAGLLPIYAFFFMMSLLGRYRIPIYLVLFFAVIFLDSEGILNIDKLAPIQLLGPSFAFAREVVPWNLVLGSLGMGVVFAGVALTLALIREGSVAALTAEKMSYREKVFMAMLLFCLTFVTIIFESEEIKVVPPEFKVARGPHVVHVDLNSGLDQEEAGRIAEAVLCELFDLADFLALDSAWRIILTTRRDFDTHKYERATDWDLQYPVVRANFASPDFDHRRFGAWLAAELLKDHSNERVLVENRRWVLDGFGPFWLRRDQTGTEWTDHRRLTLRSLVGTRDGNGPEKSGGWLVYRDRVGEEIASAVAWSRLNLLRRLHGDEVCRDFLRNALAADFAPGLLALAQEHRWPVKRLLAEAAGVSAGEFLACWRSELDSLRIDLAKDLASVPVLRGELRLEALHEQAWCAIYEFDAEPLPADNRFRFLYHKLPPFDGEVALKDIAWVSHDLNAAAQHELPKALLTGERLYYTFAVRDTLLDCQLITGWTRQEVAP